MKKCPNCDGELRDDADVCQYCGQTVPLKSVLVIMDQPQETKTEKETPVVSSPTTNGLSKAEHEQFTTQFTTLNKGVQAEVELLEKINGKLAFLKILVIITLALELMSILRACAGL